MNLITALGLASMVFVVLFTLQAYSGADAVDGGQSRRQSIIEAWVNIAAGFSVNYVANWLLLPLVGAHLSAASNLWLGFIYTAISMLRQFTIRRWFEGRIRRMAHRLAQ